MESKEIEDHWNLHIKDRTRSGIQFCLTVEIIHAKTGQRKQLQNESQSKYENQLNWGGDSKQPLRAVGSFLL